MAEQLRKLVIVGGGTAGWMAAAAISKAMENMPEKCAITLIEAPDISTVGVGEATIPPIVSFLQFLGVDEQEFMRATQATFKLAIKFQDWKIKGESFYHPFGSVGVTIDGHDFASCWLKAKSCGEKSQYTDYSPAAVMAETGKFFLPHKAEKESFLAGASYAYHFDASLVAKFFSAFSVKKGVQKMSGKVTEVLTDNRGFISSLKMASGSIVDGDFFIDCTGFHGLLIEKSLASGYEDWSDYLPCNRAVAVQTENTGSSPPYTTATAVESGWIWNVPLQHRDGNGYVYCSDYCSDDEAITRLQANIQGSQITEAHVIPFVTGKRKRIWNKNCLALGLSSGFLEPLESTAIHLVMRGVRAFLDLFPDKQCNQALTTEYNRIMSLEYESIRDFIVLHYCTTQRQDSAFWQRCQEMPVPQSLQQKISLYRACGALEYTPGALFKEPSWHCLFQGMGVEAQTYSSLLNGINTGQLSSVLMQVKDLMKKMAAGLPTHDQFLEKYCA